MKVQIHDAAILNRITPIDLAAYLRSTHWHEVDRKQGRYTVWSRARGREQLEVLLPLNPQVRDYPNRIAEALHSLEVAEQRPQLAILADIQQASSDVIRIMADHEQFRDGSIPIAQGRQLVEHAFLLIQAAALSAYRPRESHGERIPPQVAAYLERVRLGPTEQGSFVLAIQSPIPPALRSAALARAAVLEEPFERRVTRTLMLALSVLHDAVFRSAASGELDPFFEAVPQGVSANLCEALAGLHEGAGAHEIRVQVSWAPTRPLNEAIAGMVAFTDDAAPLLREAGRALRAGMLREEFVLAGFVTDVQAPHTAIITGPVDGTFRPVQVLLNADQYALAADAYTRRVPVRCEGDLVRTNTGYVLRSPHDLAAEG